MTMRKPVQVQDDEKDEDEAKEEVLLSPTMNKGLPEWRWSLPR
jgi:hypothetical protein